jgi:hypothetical protein
MQFPCSSIINLFSLKISEYRSPFIVSNMNPKSLVLEKSEYKTKL